MSQHARRRHPPAFVGQTEPGPHLARMLREQPVRATTAERVELDPLDDEPAVGELAVLAGVEQIRLEDLQLERHRQPIAHAAVADAHQALAALDHGAGDQRLQPGEVG